MTQDEKDRIDALSSQLNGPQGWFVKVETRLDSLEKRMNMTFKVLGAIWGLTVAVIIILIGMALNYFSHAIAVLQQLEAIH